MIIVIRCLSLALCCLHELFRMHHKAASSIPSFINVNINPNNSSTVKKQIGPYLACQSWSAKLYWKLDIFLRIHYRTVTGEDRLPKAFQVPSCPVTWELRCTVSQLPGIMLHKHCRPQKTQAYLLCTYTDTLAQSAVPSQWRLHPDYLRCLSAGDTLWLRMFSLLRESLSYEEEKIRIMLLDPPMATLLGRGP